MRKEKCGKYAEAVQNELGAASEKEGKGRRRKRRKRRRKDLEVLSDGAGTQPQPWMEQKGKQRAKPRLKNEQ